MTRASMAERLINETSSDMILLRQSPDGVALSPRSNSHLTAIISLHVILLYFSHWFRHWCKSSLATKRRRGETTKW